MCIMPTKTPKKTAEPMLEGVEYVTTRPKKGQVRIAVESNEYSGGVNIVTKDRDGNIVWYIGEITTEGELVLSSGIPKDNPEGLKVGKEGHIKTTKF